MAKTVKMCDMDKGIAITVFEMLNRGKIKYGNIQVNGYWTMCIVTDEEPKNLIYPEGWYYAKGCFRNKNMSTSGVYYEIRMVQSNGIPWRNIATYCTLYE